MNLLNILESQICTNVIQILICVAPFVVIHIQKRNDDKHTKQTDSLTIIKNCYESSGIISAITSYGNYVSHSYYFYEWCGVHMQNLYLLNRVVDKTELETVNDLQDLLINLLKEHTKNGVHFIDYDMRRELCNIHNKEIDIINKNMNLNLPYPVYERKDITADENQESQFTNEVNNTELQ